MSLVKYNKKRDFKSTAEPKGKLAGGGKQKLIFVVQQHDASHLHYDFRLEMEGVLKSWAVPKGPSLNPDDRRLAMMVEDHPFDYRDFEGTIPEGNYGAGNVIVWDNGTYESIDSSDTEEAEKKLLAGLKKGHISFILNGHKLKGEFSLIKLRGRQENQWLLIKKSDKYAKDIDILKNNKSVITSKPLIPRERKTVSKKKVHPQLIQEKKEKSKPEKKSSKSPGRVKAMLAELHDKPFDDKDWIFELKYDGYRAIASVDGKSNVDLYSRNLLSFNSTFPNIADELSQIDKEVILDGEIVVEDKSGKSQFQLIQNYQRTGKGNLKYYVFDLLSLDGHDITELPLTDRKELLDKLLNLYPLKNVIYSDHIEEKGKIFFGKAEKNHQEGIIAKQKDSVYVPGTRSKQWLKVKITRQQEVIITGITDPKGGRKFFGSLLLGVYENKKLVYVGNCGTGFNYDTLKELHTRLKPLFINSSPFEETISGTKDVQWIKPKIVCEVKFSEWTGDGIMRHPVYLGLRVDKNPAEIIREIPETKKTGQKITGKKKENLSEELPDKKPAVKKGSQSVKDKSTTVKNKKTSGGESILTINKTELQITNREKIYWPDEKITKGELIDYYSEIADVMLPYLKDRPQSMHRFPNGIKGPSFFQKDVDLAKIPNWLKTAKVFSESNKEYINYLVCNDRQTLVYMANLGCIEINPWNSRVQKPENPDWLVIDLDPEDISFSEVVVTAQKVHKLLESLDIESYCKTSGSTGLHIFIPTGGKYDYDIIKTFAELIANTIQQQLPEITSIVRSPSKRQKKVYLDFLQNRRGQTLAAPYSVRPKPGATVSTPLLWEEVNNKLSPSQFTMKNILKRLDKKDDLWKPVIGAGVNILKAIKKMNKE